MKLGRVHEQPDARMPLSAQSILEAKAESRLACSAVYILAKPRKIRRVVKVPRSGVQEGHVESGKGQSEVVSLLRGVVFFFFFLDEFL